MDMNTALIPIMGIMVPIVIVPTILGLRHARIERELEHAERMKALELGRTLPKDESWWSPPRIAVAFGVAVPIGVFFCAWLASDPATSQTPLWLSAGIVGLAGIVSGSSLAHHHFTTIAAGHRGADHSYAKPHVDADAFDVVGSRG